MKARVRRTAGAVVAALALLWAAMPAQAKFLEQPEAVRPFEAEIFYGMGTGFKFHDTNSDGGGTLGAEFRGNLKGTPWDVGGFLRYDATGYDFKHLLTPEQITEGMIDHDNTNQAFTIGAVSHYNFRQGRKVNPFVGLGLGVSFYSTQGHDFQHLYSSDGCTVSFIPKIGVELFSWVRFTGYAFLMRNGYNTVGLSVGLTIGGWRRK